MSKPRFTSETEQILRAAGWFSGRTVGQEQMDDWLVINWNPVQLPPQGYTKIFPAAYQALKEFGGLKFTQPSHFECPETYFLNPLRVTDSGFANSIWHLHEWAVGQPLFPLGTLQYTSEDELEPEVPLVISPDGRVFLIYYNIFLLGNTIESAIDNLINGNRNHEKITNATATWTNAIAKRIVKRIQDRELQLLSGNWPDQPFLTQEKRVHLDTILDWNDEAYRITSAFGIKEPCTFVGLPHWKTLQQLNETNWKDRAPLIQKGLRLIVNYDYWRKGFALVEDVEEKYNHPYPSHYEVLCNIYWDNNTQISVHPSAPDDRYNHIMAMGLLNLGLLTPEIEEELNFFPSHHQKLEWQIAFEERLRAAC